MLDASERRGWVEAIKDLKSQYYVGSQDAFRYLKAMRWYEKVREEILHANPALAQKFDLSVKMVAWWVTAVRQVLQCVLDLEASKVSTCSSISIGSEHIIISSLDSQRVVRERLFSKGNVWTLDFPACLIAFLSDLPSGEIDSRLAIVLLAKWLRKNFRQGHICPIFFESQQPVTYHQFRFDQQFRQLLDVNALWGQTWAQLEDETKRDASGFVTAHQLLFHQAMADDDLVSAHSLLQELWIRRLITEFQHVKFNLDVLLRSTHCVADCWLYDDNLYERAEREYILGSVQIERRVALNAVHSSGLDDLPISPTALVEEILDKYRSRIHHHQELMRIFPADTNNTGSFSDHFVIEESKILKRYQYIYRALHQNKRWLIDFLSH